MPDDFDVIGFRVILPIGDDFVPVEEGDEDLDFPVVAVMINGVDLRTLVVDALRKKRPGVDFWFDSDALCLDLRDVAPPSRHWLGVPSDSELVVDDYVAVLTCSCGAFGCGGTAAHIVVGDDVVTWSDFVDPWCTPEDVGTFRFDRTQYERELNNLA
jgi:hypothetical protein